MKKEIWCLLTTVENPQQAKELATGAVNSGLAACVQIEDAVTSVYKWKGVLESATESRLMFKFARDKKEALRLWLRRNHPYEVPEILAWPVPEVDPAYADWVHQS